VALVADLERAQLAHGASALTSSLISSESQRRSPDNERMDDRGHAAPHRLVGRDFKPAGAHQFHGWTGAAASACEAAPRFQQIVLARREEPGVPAYVFDEEQLPIRAQHAGDLAQSA